LAFGEAFAGRSVLVTGHTGFKGSWLTSWLLRLGARVSGYALDPSAEPNLYGLLRPHLTIADHRGDVRDTERLLAVLRVAEPEIVFHLAGQPIVRRSYETPLETLETNTLGTASILEAVRRLQKPCVIVVVTSDKCYENSGWARGYREEDPLGGHDPYSASKAAAELVVQSWRRSFFPPSLLNDHGVQVASARAGNVIGGGDWSPDRLIPDCVRALTTQSVIRVRNPRFQRPWQHVLEPLSGYLWLAACMTRDKDQTLSSAWNLAPAPGDVRSVAEVVEAVVGTWGSGHWQDVSEGAAPYEAPHVALCADKAMNRLSWRPTWSFETSLAETVHWYRRWADGERDIWGLCQRQIEGYTAAAQARSLPWAFDVDELPAPR
jgi:CDP-glucose 4,6-dehydratase